MKIYEVHVDDGTTQFFDNKAEADFYFRDTRDSGFGVRMQEFDMPETAKDFAEFMNRRAIAFRKLILAAKELAI